ncbi:MAG: alpha/beta hydrolase [Planctomycetota bacterium]
MRSFLLLLALAGCARSFLDDPSNVAFHRDLTYATVDGEEMQLDLLVPRAPVEPPTLIVWVHGGSWKYGTRRDIRIDWLVERGYAVASPSYRFAQDASWPAQLHDLKAAVRWLRAHGETYGYRTDRIAAAGMSAGGHLALMLSLTNGENAGALGDHLEQSSDVQGVIAYYAPTDLAYWGRFQSSNRSSAPIPMLLGAAPRDDPERAKAASPIYRVGPKSPPALLVHGDEDSIVPVDQSRRLHERYASIGRPSQLVIVEGAGHVGNSTYFGNPRRRAEVLQFLKTYFP